MRDGQTQWPASSRVAFATENALYRRRKRGAEFEEATNSVETVYPFLEELEQLGGIQRLTELECQKVSGSHLVLSVI